MKNQWVLYGIVILVSAVAGVAIAGTPTNVSTEPTISAPPTTERPIPTTIPAPEPTTPPTTTEPAVDTTTTVESTTTTTAEPAPDPADIAVVAVNGADTQGLASRVRDELIFFGFSAARATDGATVVDETVVYYFDGFERAAQVIAEFFELDPESIRPVEEAPDFGVQDGDQVAVYLGRDRG